MLSFTTKKPIKIYLLKQIFTSLKDYGLDYFDGLVL